MLTACCLQANRRVADSGAVKKLLAEGEEAASFIKTFVVQAKLNDRGNYGEPSVHCPAAYSVSEATKECHADQPAHLCNSANHAGGWLSLPCTVACFVNISKIVTTLLVVCTEMKVQPHHADATAEEAALRR